MTAAVAAFTQDLNSRPYLLTAAATTPAPGTTSWWVSDNVITAILMAIKCEIIQRWKKWMAEIKRDEGTFVTAGL